MLPSIIWSGKKHPYIEFDMTEFWEEAFADKQVMWGFEPTTSAILARDYFVKNGVKDVLIPGIGYGRNAKPFLDSGMSITGIEISETAIALARSKLDLQSPIHHGSLTGMPSDSRKYDGIFCYGLIHLLNTEERAKLIGDCYNQLAPGGTMIFTFISKKAPMYGLGRKLGEDWYERLPNLKMYFYDVESAQREFGAYGLLECLEIEEPSNGGVSLSFICAICQKL